MEEQLGILTQDMTVYNPHNIIIWCTFALILLIIAIAYLNGRLGYMKTWFYKQYRASWPKEKSAGFSFFAAVGVCFLFSILMEISAHII